MVKFKPNHDRGEAIMEIVNLYIGGGIVIAAIQATVLFTGWITKR